ncbi:MAG: hypothetical protein K0V04_18400 [Deltaproteobacteria bacterium]|nr:hypothetical protein [Deltaproteobacteria bacterium]
MSELRTVIVGERHYEVELSASGDALRARYEGLQVELPLWTGARHLDALRRHVTPGPDGLVLDATGYAAELLGDAGVEPEQWPDLTPLALWWSARPELAQAHDDEGWVTLPCGTRARVRECSWRARIEAARRGLTGDDGVRTIDPVAVLDRVLEHVVVDVEPEARGAQAGRGLASASFGRLATAVLDRVAPQTRPESLPDDREGADSARRVLDVCRALGRTPSEVLEMPAAEIDLVEALMERSSPTTRATSVAAPSRTHAPLHDAPDAFVITFGDGGSR